MSDFDRFKVMKAKKMVGTSHQTFSFPYYLFWIKQLCNHMVELKMLYSYVCCCECLNQFVSMA